MDGRWTTDNQEFSSGELKHTTTIGLKHVTKTIVNTATNHTVLNIAYSAKLYFQNKNKVSLTP